MERKSKSWKVEGEEEEKEKDLDLGTVLAHAKNFMGVGYAAGMSQPMKIDILVLNYLSPLC